MSVPTYLQSSLVPFAMRATGVGDYKNAVCKKLWGVNMTPTLIEDESDCGPATAVGTKKFSFNAELLFNVSPDGATELSLNEIATWANDGTQVDVLLQYGSSYYRQGSGSISNYTESAPLNGFVSATFTVTGTGLLDLTP